MKFVPTPTRGMPMRRAARYNDDPARRPYPGGPRIGTPTSLSSPNKNYGMGILTSIYA